MPELFGREKEENLQGIYFQRLRHYTSQKMANTSRSLISPGTSNALLPK